MALRGHPVRPRAVPADASSARPGAGFAARLSVSGLVLTVLGAAAVACALTFLDWFRDARTEGSPSADDSTFGTIHDQLSAVALTGQAKARFVPAQYFGWLAWVLLGVVLVVAVFACLPTTGASVLHVLAPVLALVAVAVTFAAIDLVEVTDSAVVSRAGDQLDYVEYLQQAGPAFYAAIVGFLVMALGARRGARED